MRIVSIVSRAKAVKWPVASLVALALCACGGGGGGDVSFIPAPPPAPPAPPPPPPPPSPIPPATISAPAAGSTTRAATLPPVLATTGGANFTTAPPTYQTFPLLQTTLVLDSTSIKPDAAINAAGGGATSAAGAFSINIGAYGGAPVSSGHSNLDWTRVGYWSTGGTWDYWEADVVHRGVFVTGFETPASAMPTVGSATYSGLASGSVFYPVSIGSGAALCNCSELSITGKASFTADFGARSVTGSLTEMWAGGDPWTDGSVGGPWNDVAFTSAISGNRFSGTSRASTAPSGGLSLAIGATGTVEGKFFGPAAQEAAAVWTLFDGTNAAIGTLTGKRP